MLTEGLKTLRSRIEAADPSTLDYGEFRDIMHHLCGGPAKTSQFFELPEGEFERQFYSAHRTETWPDKARFLAAFEIFSELGRVDWNSAYNRVVARNRIPKNKRPK